MRFTPKSEDDLEAALLLAEGEYPFQVLEASDEKSKKGNDMIKLKLDVFGPHSSFHVYDYISDAFMAHKLRHFCYSVGLEASYNDGSLTSGQCIGHEGYVRIAIEDAANGYKAKNVVDDYVFKATEAEAAIPKAQPEAQAEAPAVDAEGDDVPF